MKKIETEEEEKPYEVNLLKNKFYGEDGIFINYALNFSDGGKEILKKTATDERMINYNNFLFETANPFINNFDFLKRFGSLHDLLIDVLNEKINIFEAAEEQNEMIKKIAELKGLILLEEESITKKKHKVLQRKQKQKHKENFFAAQKSVLKNALRLYKKRTDVIPY